MGKEGWPLKKAVGDGVGDSVGVGVGGSDGFAVRLNVGRGVRALEGRDVLWSDGLLDGLLVGLLVGSKVESTLDDVDSLYSSAALLILSVTNQSNPLSFDGNRSAIRRCWVLPSLSIGCL